MTASPPTFGDVLRYFRLRRSISQRELADRTGISVRALCELERGRTQHPHRSTVELLVNGLGLTQDEAAEFAGMVVERRRRMAPGATPVIRAAVRSVAACALPPQPAELIGRQFELDLLARCAREEVTPSRPRIAVVHGSPGVGKTVLALTAAQRLAGRFRDGCRYLDLRGTGSKPLTPAEAVHRLLRGLGVDEHAIPADVEYRFALYHSLLREHEVLLVLDNVVNETQLRPLLAAGPESMVLATSRNSLGGVGARCQVPLNVLGREDSVELLGRTCGARRVTAEPEAAWQVARLCGGLPLALVIAGHRLANRPQWSIGHLAEQLGDERRRLTMLTVGDLQVRAAFESSYVRLPAATARMFRLLAVSPSPDTSVEVAAVLAQRSPAAAQAALEELVDAGLLVSGTTPGWYRCQELLRVFAAERLELEEYPEEVQRAGERLWAGLVAVTTENSPSAPRLTTRDLGAALATAEHLNSHGWMQLTWCGQPQGSIATTAMGAFRTGRWSQQLATQQLTAQN